MVEMMAGGKVWIVDGRLATIQQNLRPTHLN